jgi:hypothetical protein
MILQSGSDSTENYFSTFLFLSEFKIVPHIFNILIWGLDIQRQLFHHQTGCHYVVLTLAAVAWTLRFRL